MPLDVLICIVLCRGLFGALFSFGKKVQGSLPIVGLISRLTSPEGGFDEQASAYRLTAIHANNDVFYQCPASELVVNIYPANQLDRSEHICVLLL